MGIPIDPGYRLYQGSCICYPSGKVPKKIYISLEGVEKTPVWIEPDGPAPGGIFLCEKCPDSNDWVSRGGWFIATFTLTDTETFFIVDNINYFTVFYSEIHTPCKFGGVRTYQLGDPSFDKGVWQACSRD